MEIKDIPLSQKYEGYLWLSNAKDPVVFRNEAVTYKLPGAEKYFRSSHANPFIVDAELYDSQNQISWHIQNAGNITICQKYDVKSSDEGKCEEVTFASHRMDGSGLKFRDIWEPEPDEACLGMEVLKLKKRVFVGFKEK